MYLYNYTLRPNSGFGLHEMCYSGVLEKETIGAYGFRMFDF